MTLQLFAHPFSSYCWKVLIALWENELPFIYRPLDPEHPKNGAEWARRWPIRKMPVLLDGERTVMETSAIIEHLQIFHPGPVTLIPEQGATSVEVRMMDRIFDNYVMTPMTKLVSDVMRAPDAKDAQGVAEGRQTLDTIYAWLEERMVERTWSAGDSFSLADCAAAPALFYADWVHPIPNDFGHLRGYRARLLDRPSVARAVDEARPYRHLFPPGAPDQD
jgi:glutathione S-transferase